MPWAGFRTIFSRMRWKWVALCAALLGVCGVLFYYIVQLIIGLMIIGSIMGDDNTMRDSVKNKRGDKVEISTEVFINQYTPDKTVIRLKRAHHWFWTTLLIADGFGIHEDMSWQNNNILKIKLDFGCIVRIEHRFDTIGPIRTFYHFTNHNRRLGDCPKGSSQR